MTTFYSIAWFFCVSLMFRRIKIFDWLIVCLFDCMFVCLFDWLIDRLVDWLTDWLIDWLIERSIDHQSIDASLDSLVLPMTWNDLHPPTIGMTKQQQSANPPIPLTHDNTIITFTIFLHNPWSIVTFILQTKNLNIMQNRTRACFQLFYLLISKKKGKKTYSDQSNFVQNLLKKFHVCHEEIT